MPNRSRSGVVSRPARVVAPTRVNGGSSILTERAAGPSPTSPPGLPGSLDPVGNRFQPGKDRHARVVDRKGMVAEQRDRPAGLEHLQPAPMLAVALVALEHQDHVTQGQFRVTGWNGRIALDHDDRGRAEDGQVGADGVEEVRHRAVVGQEAA